MHGPSQHPSPAPDKPTRADLERLGDVGWAHALRLQRAHPRGPALVGPGGLGLPNALKLALAPQVGSAKSPERTSTTTGFRGGQGMA
jgi:hypothetical protein